MLYLLQVPDYIWLYMILKMFLLVSAEGEKL
jgi:hypothetical protein